jgi:hypothetical protein
LPKEAPNTQRFTQREREVSTSVSDPNVNIRWQRGVEAKSAKRGPSESSHATDARDSETIPAIPVTIEKGGRIELGAIVHLAADAALECVDDGFDPRTVRVQCKGRYYIVFRQDLERIGLYGRSE